MNVVFPLYELSGDSSEAEAHKMLQMKLLVLKMNFIYCDFR